MIEPEHRASVMIGVQIYNALEAVWWLALSVVVATCGRGVRGFTLRRQLALTVFLAAFGISDIIEFFTGAWWSPPALLVLNAVCLAGLVITAGMVYSTRWKRC